MVRALSDSRRQETTQIRWLAGRRAGGTQEARDNADRCVFLALPRGEMIPAGRCRSGSMVSHLEAGCQRSRTC